jgi:ABC-type Mn2+/Zn2+ transport system ATPase subunit
MSHDIASNDTVSRPVSIAPLVRLDSVSCRYQNGPLVLDDVGLVVRPGEFTGIVGPSGSGKTTLLQVLLGIVQPVSGTVDTRACLRIGYVPQVETINWNFPVTVFEAVLMSSRRKRTWPWASRSERQQVGDVLDRLGIGELSGRHIRQLSGGQQQRVFIARALFSSPDLLLLDEPTSGVDVRTRHEVLHLLTDLNADGLAIVLTTHDLNGIAAHLPNVVCLHTTVMGVGRPVDVLTPEILERTYGAPMDVLQHAGMPLIVDRRQHVHATDAS